MLEKFPQLVMGTSLATGIKGQMQSERHTISRRIGRTGIAHSRRSRVLGCQRQEWVIMQQVSLLPVRSALLSCIVNAQVKANL